MSLVCRLMDCARRFVRSQRGNVAWIYGLSLIPLALAAGGGLDYARAIVVRNSMSAALDAAALAVGSSPGLSSSQQQTLAQQYFNANYHENADYGTPTAVTLTPNGQSMLVATSLTMPTTMLKMVGIQTMTVDASSKVVWGQLKVWVSLVLDNTGSMCQSDAYPNASSPCNPPNSGSKIAVLKSATHNLLTMLQGAASNPGDVKVAIVPFVNQVNAGTTYVTASWLDWSLFGTCNISGINDQGTCTTTHGTWTSSWWGGGSCNISGYSTKSTCEAATGTWTPRSHSNWTGCVTDRGNVGGPDTTYNYDAMNSPPVVGRLSSYFPAVSCDYGVQSLMALSNDWTTLGNKVDAMVASGSTNQTIGLAWGWHALTNSDPLNSGVLPAGTAKYIIILSDGLNTKDRWYGNGSSQSTQVDARMTQVCTNAKADGIVIYAVFVDIGGTQGNSSVLQNCASDSSKYFDLTSASQITAAFAAIGQQITNLRVSQ